MKALVIGDLCQDVYVYGQCVRLNPEAPSPVFNPIHTVKNSGMAGNVAENLKALGAEVDLMVNHETIIKTRLVDRKSNYTLLRIDENDRVSNSFDISKVDFGNYDVVLIADYDKGYLSKNDIASIGERHPLVFVDTKKSFGTWAVNVSFIKINEPEWEKWESSGVNYQIWKDRLIITLSERGAKYNDEIIPTEKVNVSDVAGAGDTFMAALAFHYVKTKDIKQSIAFANKCSGEVVQRRGVSVI